MSATEDPCGDDSTEIGSAAGHHRNVVSRSVKDPIHDLIPLSPKLSMFIDTKQFQRLRKIKQLGTSYYVWPGASHNRFEHCIGVAFLARSMATHLQKNQPELNITDRDVECLEIAGLCHDLGHGPWSHVWDGRFIPTALPGSDWKHEDASEMMLDYLIEDNDIPILEDDAKFIKALIAGDRSRCSKYEKPFLFDIVANKRNGLDVDKFDYILRDSHMVGDPVRIALPRIIQSARVLDDQICYDIKDANQIYEICATRFKLHKIVYNHKAATAVEYMIVDALLAAEPFMHIADRIYQPKKYLYLTDNLLDKIEESEEPELATSRAIVERIRNRELYKMVDYKVVDYGYRDFFKKHMTPESVVEAARSQSRGRDFKSQHIEGLTPDDVIVDLAVMHYGMKESNPLDFMKFYSKRNPNTSAKAGRGDYSTLMPQCHAEVLVRVYTRKAKYFGIVQVGYRANLKAMQDLLSRTSPPLEFGSFFSTSPTPPATEAPSTPRASFSRPPSFTFGPPGSVGGTPFSENAFTTVATTFVPPSPSQKHKNRNRSAKRQRGMNSDEPGGLSKRKRTAL